MLRYKIDGIFFLFIALVSFPHFISYSKEEKPSYTTTSTFESLINRANSFKHVKEYTLKSREKEIVKITPKRLNITKVTATVYFPEAAQTDSSPLITADGSRINETHPKKHKWIAVSRNLLTRWGGHIDYGDKVNVSGISKRLDGVYIVRDTMKKRIRNRIDILVGADDNVMGFWNDVKLTKL